ncbi:hypothetical protein [Ruminococcus sp. 5_1_39BFAA]|uniref:hypothetical protein n=1 Tax=Ruminococcus sp. 5_1_39BFAA TaxID=457412 RepID=UPI0035688D3E
MERGEDMAVGHKKAKRKPGGGRKPSKPDYNPSAILQNQMDAAVSLYDKEEHPSLQTIADELDLNPIKVRKLLITAGVYRSEVADQVNRVFNKHRASGLSHTEAIAAMMRELNLSKSSVTSYLPYEKGVYFPVETDSKNLSVGAERIRRMRKRERIIERIKTEQTEEALWAAVIEFQGYKFRTYSGLVFSYSLKKGRGDTYTKELFIDRRENSKSLAWSSVLLAFHNIPSIGSVVDRPKALGDIRGVTYIYAMFYRFGLIDAPQKAKEKMEPVRKGETE